MILQSSTLSVKPDLASDFESAFRTAQAFLARQRGYISHELHKCVEIEGRYMLHVKWQSLSDHAVGFKRSPDFAAFQGLLQAYYESEQESVHYINIRLDHRQ